MDASSILYKSNDNRSYIKENQANSLFITNDNDSHEIENDESSEINALSIEYGEYENETYCDGNPIRNLNSKNLL